MLSTGDRILLSIRLYTNNDAANILWEYAFEYLVLDSRIAGYDNQTEDTWYVTADDPTVPLQAFLVGYANRDEEIKEPITLRWQVDGDGSLESYVQTDNDLGVFANELAMPTTAGSVGTVKALLQGG